MTTSTLPAGAAPVGIADRPAPGTPGAAGGPPLVLFDGVCNLCNASVLYVIDRDPAARFRFAPLQGETARALLGGDAPVDADPSSIVLLEDGRRHDRSTAALRIARRLRGPVALLWAAMLVPRPIRDAVYGWVARNRYRWFGRTESCRIPTPELRSRFLD